MHTTATVNKVRITRYGFGPEGPAVVRQTMQGSQHDRNGTDVADNQSCTDSNTDGLPSDEAHKEQLQRIIANHPMKPAVREENEG